METLLTAEAIRSIREVWWDVRPHPDFGTVELRMCDALPKNKWLAARHGLDAALIAEDRGTRRLAHEAVRELVEDLRPTAARLGCAAELEGVLRILEHGAGYERQRRVVAAGGTLVDVVDALLEELRAGVPA